MALVQIDTEILKRIIKESVVEAIKTERLNFYESLISKVSDSEMQDIISLYGEKPESKEYIDYSEFFKNAN